MTHRLVADDGIVGKSLPVFVCPLIARLVPLLRATFHLVDDIHHCLVDVLVLGVASDGDCRDEVGLPFHPSFGRQEKLVCCWRRLLADAVSALSACEPLLVVLPRFPFDCSCLEATIFPLQI